MSLCAKVSHIKQKHVVEAKPVFQKTTIKVVKKENSKYSQFLEDDFDLLVDCEKEVKKISKRQVRVKPVVDYEESKVMNDDRISYLMPTERTSTFLPQTGKLSLSKLFSFGQTKRPKITDKKLNLNEVMAKEDDNPVQDETMNKLCSILIDKIVMEPKVEEKKSAPLITV